MAYHTCARAVCHGFVVPRGWSVTEFGNVPILIYVTYAEVFKYQPRDLRLKTIALKSSASGLSTGNNLVATDNRRVSRWELYLIVLFASITMTETHRPGFSSYSQQEMHICCVCISLSVRLLCFSFLSVCNSECVGQIVKAGLAQSAYSTSGNLWSL